MGDRVQLTAPDRERQIANRELGTIEAIDTGGRLRRPARFRPDRRLRTPSAHPHLDYGYAVTSHSSQGQTADRVLVHVDTERAGEQLVNRRLAYVAVSRGRYDAQIYTNDKVPARRGAQPRRLASIGRWSRPIPQRLRVSQSTRRSLALTGRNRPSPRDSSGRLGGRSRPSHFYLSTVLGGIKGPLASLGGGAALDAACAPCRTAAFSDGRLRWP